MLNKSHVAFIELLLKQIIDLQLDFFPARNPGRRVNLFIDQKDRDRQRFIVVFEMILVHFLDIGLVLPFLNDPVTDCFQFQTIRAFTANNAD